AQIAVCTSSNKQAQKLLKKLSSLSDREVVIDNSRYVPEARIVEKRRFIQVMVGHASQGATLSDYFDIRIDVGPQVAQSAWVRETPWSHHMLRIFCILPWAPASAHELYRLEEVYTRNCIQVLADQSPPPVQVIRVPGFHLRRPKAMSGFEFYRGQVWENHERNACIAKLAQAVEDRDEQAFVELGIELTTEARGVIFSNRRPGLTVLVANPAHGRQLQKLLKGFDFEHSLTAEVAGLNFDAGGLRITTHEAAEAYGIASQIVIRADGGPGWPLSPKKFPIWRLGVEQAVVFDFDDSGVQPSVNSRLQAYHDLRWDIPALSRNTNES
ncbi:MAG: hypothetical protein RIC12_00975, partial [Pirellulales bacterium]